MTYAGIALTQGQQIEYDGQLWTIGEFNPRFNIIELCRKNKSIHVPKIKLERNYWIA